MSVKKKIKKSVDTKNPDKKKTKTKPKTETKKIRVVDTRTDVMMGDYARDKITGFEGIMIAETVRLHGCNQICLEPTKLTKNGNLIDGIYFDWERIERVKKGKGFKKGYKMENIPEKDPGGPQDHSNARN